MPDLKKMAMLIVGKGKPKEEPEEEKKEDYSSEAKDQAASDVFEALKEDDKEAFTSALLDLIKECMETEE